MTTKTEIKQTALAMVKESGLINLSRRDLCQRVGIPDGSFPHVMECSFSEFIDELKKEPIGTTGLKLVSKKRTDPALRRDQILAVAVEMARVDGYNKLTRDGIAERAGVSMGLVTRYLGTMPQLKRDVMRVAIRDSIVEIIAKGLAIGCQHAKKAPQELKVKAAEYIIN